MRNKLHISIPQPCSNRWADMTHVSDDKRHCSSCEKVITDFTKMSDEQLLSYFNSNPVSCGMFSRTQIDRNIELTKKKTSRWTTTLIVSALVTVTDVQAQIPATSETVAQRSDTLQPTLKLPIDVHQTLKDSLMVNGSVFEINDAVEELPAFGAIIIFHLSDGSTQACVADIDGKFQIKLRDVHVADTVKVEVRFAGYLPYSTSIVMQNEPSETILRIQSGEYVVTDGIIIGALSDPHPVRSRIRNFFWRLFHPRSWFW